MATKMTDVPDAEALLSEDQQRWLNTYPRRAWPTVMLALAQNHAIALHALAASRLECQHLRAQIAALVTLIGDVADQQAMPDDLWKTALTAIRQGQP